MTSAHARAQSRGTSVARRRPAWIAAAHFFGLVQYCAHFGLDALVTFLPQGDVADHGHERRAHGTHDGCRAAAPGGRMAAGKIVQKFFYGAFGDHLFNRPGFNRPWSWRWYKFLPHRAADRSARRG